MKILLTGGNGFIGRHVAQALVARGHSVVSVDVRNERSGMTAPSRDTPPGDYRASFDGVSGGAFGAVVHLAAFTDTLAPASAELSAVNTTGVGRLAKACVDSSTRLIHASSTSVYGRTLVGYPCLVGDERIRSRCSGPLNAYARTKLEADKLLSETEGLQYASFRFTNVFGSGESHKGRMACILTQLIDQAVEERGIKVFADSLTAARDFVPVSYVANAICKAVDEESKQFRSGVFNLGSGVSISFARAIEWLSSELESRLQVNLIPNPNSNAYQYWTGVEMEYTRASFDLAPLEEELVLGHAAKLLKQKQNRK